MLHALPSHRWTGQHRNHLLNRAGFGFSLSEEQRPRQNTVAGWVDTLLDVPQKLEESEWPEWVKEPVVSREELREARKLSEEERRKKRQEINRINRRRIRGLKTWWFDRMEQSEHPLLEKVSLFWHGHFTTARTKVRNPVHLFHQNRLFRETGLGSIQALTVAVSRDPAMLIYLDGSGSKVDAPNENYARELLELFTLGEGHYTENDIREAARAFTGWQVRRALGTLSFSEKRFDSGEKTFLGETGSFKDEDIVDVIFSGDRVAWHLAHKIWEFFVYANPEEEVIERVASALQREQFELAPVLREIFLSEAFYSPKAMRTQIKSPVMWLMSLRRLLDFRPFPGDLSDQMTTLLGQELFNPPSVKGWDGGRNWLSTSNLILRNNMAHLLIEGGRPSEIGLGGRQLASIPSEVLESMSEERKEVMGRRLKAARNRTVASLLHNESLQEQWKDSDMNQRFSLAVKTVYQGPLNMDSLNQLRATPEVGRSEPSKDGLRRAMVKLVCHPEFQLC